MWLKAERTLEQGPPIEKPGPIIIATDELKCARDSPQNFPQQPAGDRSSYEKSEIRKGLWINLWMRECSMMRIINWPVY